MLCQTQSKLHLTNIAWDQALQWGKKVKKKNQESEKKLANEASRAVVWERSLCLFYAVFNPFFVLFPTAEPGPR